MTNFDIDTSWGPHSDTVLTVYYVCHFIRKKMKTVKLNT